MHTVFDKVGIPMLILINLLLLLLETSFDSDKSKIQYIGGYFLALAKVFEKFQTKLRRKYLAMF